jgi:hypothetical protein
MCRAPFPGRGSLAENLGGEGVDRNFGLKQVEFLIDSLDREQFDRCPATLDRLVNTEHSRVC